MNCKLRVTQYMNRHYWVGSMPIRGETAARLFVSGRYSDKLPQIRANINAVLSQISKTQHIKYLLECLENETNIYERKEQCVGQTRVLFSFFKATRHWQFRRSATESELYVSILGTQIIDKVTILLEGETFSFGRTIETAWRQRVAP